MFKELMNLENLSEAFYHSDQDITIKGKEYTIRSFTYRLATCTNFQLPYAKESRGTAYYTEKGKENWKLFCRAYPKFFNLSECIPKEEYIKDNPAQECYEKLDGSLLLISSIDNQLICKTKTSINSDQAKLAQEILESRDDIVKFCWDCIDNDYTPVFEAIGKKNVIVLRYDVDFDLVLLGTVNNKTGEITTYDDLGTIKVPKVYNYTWDELLEDQENGTPDKEGYVVKSSKGLVKVKRNSYKSLHFLKDSVNNIKALTELILSDNLDDLIGSFQDDPKTIEYITQKQEIISKKYNHLVKSVENTYEDTKHLERKEFAISNKSNKHFGLLMHKYLGKEVKYKEYFMKNKMYEK